VPINWLFSVPKFVDTDIGLLELFENVTGVRFFETQFIASIRPTLNFDILMLSQNSLLFDIACFTFE